MRNRSASGGAGDKKRMGDSSPMAVNSDKNGKNLQNNYQQPQNNLRDDGSGKWKIVVLAALVLFFLLSSATGGRGGDLFTTILNKFRMPTNTQTAADPFMDRDILPTQVRPVNYDLHLEPDFSTFKFKGHASITLQVLEDTKEVAVNAVELEFLQTVLKRSAAGQLPLTPIKQEYNDKLETMTFYFAETLHKGDQVVLAVDYVGVHNEKMAGFYKSSYEDAKTGERKYMVVTQFEPTDARKAFPCWDEPALKATFDVTLVVPSHMTALSNMNDISTRPVEGGHLKEVKFARSPIMSTYLVAFCVGELSFVETYTKGTAKTHVRVFAPTGLEKQGEFALDVAARTLDFFADYFRIAYPLPKMDMVAIPDFAAGAMENWGLVTYRTVYLLFEEGVSAAKSKERIAYVVGHELAHQWFGNLVSPGWWSDLWLNEGFATWAGWLATDKLFPEWDVWTQFVNDDFQRGLQLDSLRSSHPIEVPVKSPAEIHQIFDAISYSKGASVIRMLANYLGAEDFRTGVCNYLQAFKYKNADTKDLWHYLSLAAGGKPVGQLMNSWTRQIGYPIVEVDISSNSVLHVKQSRFLASGKVLPDEDKEIWFTPLQIITSKTPLKPSLDVLSQKTGDFPLDSIKLSSLGPDDFFKLNYKHSGFYRTKYHPEMLKRLGQAIKNGVLGSADRIGMLTDAFALAKAGRTSVTDGLSLLQNFGNEKDYVVWSDIASELATVRGIWWEQPKEVTDKLKQLTRNLFSKVARDLGWESDPKEGHLTALLRTLGISAAGKAGDKEVIAEAQRRFKLFVEQGKKDVINPNLRGACFAIVLQNGGKTEYEQVLKIYRDTATADQKLIALSSLGAINDEQLLRETLKFGISADVRPQDIIYVFGSVAGNPIGKKFAWQFVKENWQMLYDRYYKGSMSLLSRIVTSTTEDFSSEAHLKDVEQFFAGKDLPAISRSIQQTLEKIKGNSEWVARDAKPVEEWLRNNVK